MRIFHPALFPEALAPVVKAFHTRYCDRTPTDSPLRALREVAGVAP